MKSNIWNIALLAILCLSDPRSAVGDSIVNRAGDEQDAWQRSEIVSNSMDDPGAKIVTWLEKGWICVKRINSSGSIEWQFRLARHDEKHPPVIRYEDTKCSYSCVAGKGRYYVREDFGRLRSSLQLDSDTSPTWDVLSLIKLDKTKMFEMGSAARKNHISKIRLFNDGAWVYAYYGNGVATAVYAVKICPKINTKTSFSFMSMNDIVEFIASDVSLFDDGNIIVIQRITERAHKDSIELNKAASLIRAMPAPEITASRIYPENASLKLSSSKPRLVVFWGVWCIPCVQHMPEVVKLYETLGKDKLDIVAVHSTNQSERLEDFLKENKLPFTVALDTGETAKKYAVVKYPTYFVIGTNGKVVYGPSFELPRPEHVRKANEDK